MEDTKKHSDGYRKAQESLKQIVDNLTELSTLDLSRIHVGVDWSWVPHVKDHIDFLVEQTQGLIDNLHDSPPPVAPVGEPVTE